MNEVKAPGQELARTKDKWRYSEVPKGDVACEADEAHSVKLTCSEKMEFPVASSQAGRTQRSVRQGRAEKQLNNLQCFIELLAK